MFYNVRYPINIARAQACTYLEVKQAWHIVKNASTDQITMDESVCKSLKHVNSITYNTTYLQVANQRAR